MKKINLNKKIAVFGIKFALIALALNMVAFVVPLILDLMKLSVFKIIVIYAIIIYGLLVATLFVYFAFKIKIPK